MQKIVLMGCLALSVSACATVTRGTEEGFVVETDPSGAKVETSHGHFCDATPCVMKMKRESEFVVTVSKEGYKTFKTNVTHQTAGGGAAGMAGNVLLGGIVGGVIDANTGATQELVPNPLKVNLEPLGSDEPSEMSEPPQGAVSGGPVEQEEEDDEAPIS